MLDYVVWRDQGLDLPLWLIMTHISCVVSAVVKWQHHGSIHAMLTVLFKQDGSCLFSQWMQNFPAPVSWRLGQQLHFRSKLSREIFAGYAEKLRAAVVLLIFILQGLHLLLFFPPLLEICLSFHYAKCSSATQFAVPSQTLGPAQLVLTHSKLNTVTI